MFKREVSIKKISDSLAFLETSTKNRGILRLFDQHIIAETFTTNLLNIVYGYNLINLNTIDNTYAATDLADFQRKLCFQVTYTTLQNHRTKIENSIAKFIKNNLYKEFTWLRFLFLGPKQQTYTKPFDTQGLFQFDPYQDVINLQDLVRQLPTLTTQQLQGLSTLIDNEFYDLSDLVGSHKKTMNHGETLSEFKKILDKIEYAIKKGIIIKETVVG